MAGSFPGLRGIERLFVGDLIELPVELILKEIYYLSFFIHSFICSKCFVLVGAAVELELIPRILDVT